jgi:hypothetical protein
VLFCNFFLFCNLFLFLFLIIDYYSSFKTMIITGYYNGKLSEALIDLYPEANYDPSKFLQSNKTKQTKW